MVASDPPPDGAAGWAYACCCWYACDSYACWSWAAQRPACRRETRLDTAVAVPATTAVRATPRMSPGMPMTLLSAVSSLVVFGGGVERGQDGLHRQPAGRDELPTAAAHRSRQGRGPLVLVNENRGGT